MRVLVPRRGGLLGAVEGKIPNGGGLLGGEYGWEGEFDYGVNEKETSVKIIVL